MSESGPTQSLGVSSPAVLIDFFKRFVQGVIFFLAVLAVFHVPFGNKTLAQHTVALFSSPKSKEAADHVHQVAEKVGTYLSAEMDKFGKQPKKREMGHRP